MASRFVSEPFSERLDSLLSFDCVRFSRIMETIEYGCAYAVLTFFAGTLIDALMQNLYPGEKKCEPLKSEGEFWRCFLFVVLQSVFSAVSIIYIRKIAQLLPFVFDVCPEGKYAAHQHVSEYEGEILIALVFIGSQSNLVRQLIRLRNYLVPASVRFDDNACK